MRFLYFLLIIFLFGPLPAKANRLTGSDFDTAQAINQALYVALVDMAKAGKAMEGFSLNTYCMDQIFSALMMVQSNMLHVTTLVVIDRVVTTKSDEEEVIGIIKTAIDGVLTEFNHVRDSINRYSGACSKSPLLVAKAEQALQLLHRANSFVTAISKRL